MLVNILLYKVQGNSKRQTCISSATKANYLQDIIYLIMPCAIFFSKTVVLQISAVSALYRDTQKQNIVQGIKSFSASAAVIFQQQLSIRLH